MRIAALLAALVTPSLAFAQTSPGLTYGQVPTVGQWNAAFSAKQDYLNCTGFLFGTAGASTACLSVGTGVGAALGTNVGSYGSVVVNGGALGTPSSGNAGNITNIPTSGFVGTLYAAQAPPYAGDCTASAGSLSLTCTKTAGTSFGTLATVNGGAGVIAALQDAAGTGGGIVTYNGDAGTPTSLVLTNATGTPTSIGLAHGTGLPIAGTTGWGTGVAALLAQPSDSAGGVAGFSNLASDLSMNSGVQTAITHALDASTGLVSYSSLAVDVKAVLSIATTVASAIQNAVNGASGLLQLNASGYIPFIPAVGVATNSSAAAGNIGETISLDVASASAVTNTTSTTAYNVGSVTLTAGDWDCSANVAYTPASATVTLLSGWISGTSATNPTTVYDQTAAFVSPVSLTTSSQTVVQPTGVVRVSCTSSACTVGTMTATAMSLYLGTAATFSAGTIKSYGQMLCRRMR